MNKLFRVFSLCSERNVSAMILLYTASPTYSSFLLLCAIYFYFSVFDSDCQASCARRFLLMGKLDRLLVLGYEIKQDTCGLYSH